MRFPGKKGIKLFYPSRWPNRRVGKTILVLFHILLSTSNQEVSGTGVLNPVLITSNEVSGTILSDAIAILIGMLKNEITEYKDLLLYCQIKINIFLFSQFQKCAAMLLTEYFNCSSDEVIPKMPIKFELIILSSIIL